MPEGHYAQYPLDPQLPERRMRKGKRKKTKQWCKGVVGRPHTREVQLSNQSWQKDCKWVKYGWRSRTRKYKDRDGNDVFWQCAHVEVCTTCGKVLRYSWDLDVEDCPEYRFLHGPCTRSKRLTPFNAMVDSEETVRCEQFNDDHHVMHKAHYGPDNRYEVKW